MKQSKPFSSFDDSSYNRLARGTDYTGRQLWRILHARYHLATGHIRDVLNRIWFVPSTRVEGRTYRVDLNTLSCTYEDGNGEQKCPDLKFQGKNNCVHIEAARVAERQFQQHNRQNVLTFVDRPWMPAPTEVERAMC